MSELKSVFVVVDDKGKFWPESVRADRQGCQRDFVAQWLPRCSKYVTSHIGWVVWGCFEKAGWRIEELELPFIKPESND